ncbi:hypothetical protein K491DRAFT_565036, partial [Lophiostoma macrostomum CBS 122681]
YPYGPLKCSDGQEMRLLELRPGKFTDPIRCDLVHVNLRDDLVYEALSYTWATDDGDEELSKVMKCSNHIMNISVTCDAALRTLRDPFIKRTLWVDQVCINQKNTKERSQQVVSMNRIYSRASAVQVVVGIGHPEGKGTPPERRVLTALFSRRWFGRLWVVQEVALARFAMIHFGEQQMRLSDNVLNRLGNVCRDLGVRIPPPLRWSPDYLRGSQPLLACLSDARPAACKEPEDKVFAVRSLMEPSIQPLVPVDYAKPFSETYIRVAIAAIETNRSLDVL